MKWPRNLKNAQDVYEHLEFYPDKICGISDRLLRFLRDQVRGDARAGAIRENVEAEYRRRFEESK